MNIVTPQSKPFTWSYSKLKNWETCARRFSEVELKKSYEERSQELDRGDKLHAAMYSRIESGAPLPPEFIYMEKWAEKLTHVIHPCQTIQCELKLALDWNYNPTGFMDRTTWFRVKIDYLRIVPLEGRDVDIAHVVDYKTGQPKHDPTQLALCAFAVFATYKTVAAITTEYIWTEYGDTSHADFLREDMPRVMADMLPRVSKMQTSIEKHVFEPRPCGLCKRYCPVSSCEFYGRGSK